MENGYKYTLGIIIIIAMALASVIYYSTIKQLDKQDLKIDRIGFQYAALEKVVMERNITLDFRLQNIERALNIKPYSASKKNE